MLRLALIGGCRQSLNLAGRWLTGSLIGMSALPCELYAQTAVGAPAPASPVVGQISLARSPLSQVSAGNQSRFNVVPSIRTVYDTNVLRSFETQSRPGDNLRTTIGVDVDIKRAFGRVAAGVSGTVGYDFNSRYRFLNRSRIDLYAKARAPVGAVCQVSLDARYERFQFDFGDTQQLTATALRNQTYSILGQCRRGAGFSPVIGATYRSLRSGSSGFYDYDQYSEQLGISYAQPSLGVVTLSGSAQQLRRPRFLELIGTTDDTDVRSISLGLERAVSPRIQMNVSVGLTQADPSRENVKSFLGASYNGEIQWLVTPRFVVSGVAARAVTNQNGVDSTYVIRDDYSLAVNWQATARSHVRIAAVRTNRDFRGESLLTTFRPIRADETSTISASYDYDLGRRIRLGLGIAQRWREADNPIYNYKATQVSASVGARF